MAADVHRDLLDRRDDYPVLAGSTYLASHSLGAMHRGVWERLAEFADLWASRGVVAWEQWVPEVLRTADLVGSLVGAPPRTTVMHANVASLLGPLASALTPTPARNRVVYSELEWPGSHYLWSRLPGVETVVVPGNPDGVDLDPARLLDAIDERTLVVPISLVLFRSSALVDVRQVTERAHEVGALVVLDAYQAAGVVDVDVVGLDVDACVGGSVKYLCGGPGAGWMYVKPAVAERLRPWGVGWFGHARPFDFDFLEYVDAPGAARFAGGTPVVPAVYAASAGCTALAEVGVRRVRERSVSLTQPLVEDALSRGFAVRSPLDPARRGGHVTIDPGRAQEVHDRLHARGFVVDLRPGVGIRVGPHFYNTAEECTAVLDAMQEVRRELGD